MSILRNLERCPCLSPVATLIFRAFHVQWPCGRHVFLDCPALIEAGECEREVVRLRVRCRNLPKAWRGLQYLGGSQAVELRYAGAERQG